jgi:hypothetical protein
MFKMMKKNKKGFLFTFITIFMLFALVVLSYDYLQRNKTKQDLISSLSYSNRLNFMRENIVSDYFSMLDITLDEIQRQDNYIIVKFSNFSTIKGESIYPAFLLKQKDFTENNFSHLSNVNINLQNFIPEFVLFPYNTEFIIDNRLDSRDFFIRVNNYEYFNGMEIDIKLNNSIDNLNLTNIPSNTSDKPYIKVRVFDINDEIIINTTVLLNSTLEKTSNDEFKIVFNKTIDETFFPTFSVPVLQNLNLFYGRYVEAPASGLPRRFDGTFHLRVTGIEANISRVYLNFTETIDKAVLMTRASVTLR